MSMFRDFIRAFGIRWFVAMSGGLGVPLTAAGVFFEPIVVKAVFFVTAIFCAVFSSFWVWKVEHEARIKAEKQIAADFSDARQSSVDSKMNNLPLEAKRELHRVITAEIEVRQLSVGMRSALEEVGFVNPAFAYTPAEFNEQHRPFIERWFKRNQL
jgi:hypothetical protein